MLNKQVEVAFTSNAWASPLKDVADKIVLLDEGFLEGCWQ